MQKETEKNERDIDGVRDIARERERGTGREREREGQGERGEGEELGERGRKSDIASYNLLHGSFSRMSLNCHFGPRACWGPLPLKTTTLEGLLGELKTYSSK